MFPPFIMRTWNEEEKYLWEQVVPIFNTLPTPPLLPPSRTLNRFQGMFVMELLLLLYQMEVCGKRLGK